MRVLLSINPEYVSKIFDGSKKFEFRKRLPTNKSVKTVVIYSTRPVAKIVGEFDIDGFLVDTPENVWAQTWRQSGVTPEFFGAYYAGRPVAHAIRIGLVRQYSSPVELSALRENMAAPQSFVYLYDEHTTVIDARNQGDLWPRPGTYL